MAPATLLPWSDIYDRLAALEGEFTPRQVEAMGLSSHHTVLDLGAGSGRLALPMARRVKRVTALDTSADLLSQLDAQARRAGIDNIRTLCADWSEVHPGRNLPRHDVVVAARFGPADDLMKLDAAANERVHLLIFAGPSTRAFYNALLGGIADADPEPPLAQSGVVSLFNELAGLGIEPDVLHLSDGLSRIYPDEQAAFQDFAWLGVPPEFQPLLKRNIRRFLQPHEQGIRLLFETRSALVSWRK